MTYFPLSYALAYLAAANLAGLGLMMLDRHRGKNGGKRISELWLFLLGLAGGAAAMFVYMLTTGHKKRYAYFRIGLPVMVLVHLAALVVIWYFGPEFYQTVDILIEYLVGYLVAINVFGAAVTNWDKKNAQKSMWRVPEAWLMFIAALGGAFAMMLTMCVIRHKTRYLKFMLGLPIMMVAHVAFLYWLLEYCTFIVIITF